MAPPSQSNERIPEIEILRGLAITAVVGIHVSWYYTVSSDLSAAAGRSAALIHLLNGYGVPLFLALSAIGLSLRYAAPQSFAGYCELLRRRVLRLLPAYFLWSLISASLFRPDVFSSPKDVIAMLASGTADSQLYFIPLLFEIYVLWPLLRPLASASRSNSRIALGVVVAGLLFSATWWKLSAHVHVPGGILFLPFWFCYVCLGIAAAFYIETVRRWAHGWYTLGLAGLAVLASAYWMYRSFITLIEPSYDPIAVTYAATIFQIAPAAYIVSAIGALTLFAARACTSRSAAIAAATRVFSMLGGHSYGIFLVHLIVLRLLIHRFVPPTAVAEEDAAITVMMTVGAATACLATSASLVAVASSSRWLRPLFSNRW